MLSLRNGRTAVPPTSASPANIATIVSGLEIFPTFSVTVARRAASARWKNYDFIVAIKLILPVALIADHPQPFARKFVSDQGVRLLSRFKRRVANSQSLAAHMALNSPIGCCFAWKFVRLGHP